MTDKDTNWKKRLLRTSVPLEYQAAKLLAERGYLVVANFSYFRMFSGVDTEHSVDVRGVLADGLEERPVRHCVLDVLVECKYQDPGATWLFLPSPRGEHSFLNSPLQGIDVFSPRYLHDTSWDLKNTIAVCYAGVQIGGGEHDEKAKGGARESPLRHGLRQLQYALPALVALRARGAAYRDLDENFPFFFAPILLTNSPLIVAHRDFSIDAVEDADSLEELGTSVPYLTWSADLGPDFSTHAQRQLADLQTLTKTQFLRAAEERRKRAGSHEFVLPSAVARRIAENARAIDELAEFTNVLVVNLRSLGDAIELIAEAFHRSANSVHDEPLPMTGGLV